jgi:hypothetical protein
MEKLLACRLAVPSLKHGHGDIGAPLLDRQRSVDL